MLALRGTIALDRCARAHAWLSGRDYVSPDDIHAVAYDTLRHRVLLSFEAEADGIDSDRFIGELLSPRTGALSQLTSGARVDAAELIALRLRAAGLQLDSRRRVASATAGVHESRFRGRGVDYQESRVYQPGDDIRNMDWRVTARTGVAHTKLYQEERERPVILLLDYNASVFFGTRTRFKSVQMAYVASLIAWATVRYGDRIGAFVFGHGDHLELRPTGGRRGALRLIRGLVEWTNAVPDAARAVAPMGDAVKRLRRVARPGSLIVVVSDFYSLDDATERHLTAPAAAQ